MHLLNDPLTFTWLIFSLKEHLEYGWCCSVATYLEGSFIFGNGFMVVRVAVEPEPFPVTLGSRQENSPQTGCQFITEQHVGTCIHTLIHIYGKFSITSPLTRVFLDSGRKLVDPAETHSNTGRIYETPHRPQDHGALRWQRYPPPIHVQL